jgi:hypothetical protein
MEIKEAVLDEMIEFMEGFPKAASMNNMSIQVGEYKGYKMRVELVKPEEKQEQ